MQEMLQQLRMKYEAFKKDTEDVLTIRDTAFLVFEEARKRGADSVMAEVEDMLMDLLFSIEENKCGCNSNCSKC